MKTDRREVLAEVDALLARVDSSINVNDAKMAERVQRLLESAAPNYGVSATSDDDRAEGTVYDAAWYEELGVEPHVAYARKTCLKHHHYCHRAKLVRKLNMISHRGFVAFDSFKNQMVAFDKFVEWDHSDEGLTDIEKTLLRYLGTNIAEYMQKIFNVGFGNVGQLHRDQAERQQRAIEEISKISGVEGPIHVSVSPTWNYGMWRYRMQTRYGTWEDLREAERELEVRYREGVAALANITIHITVPGVEPTAEVTRTTITCEPFSSSSSSPQPSVASTTGR